jgi:hypothetical protein
MTHARISDLLNINPRFLRSVNLERDFGDALALDGYVSTAETARYLHRIGRGLRAESGERAWRITGDFGSGKSSFALVLANLLSRSAKELPKNIGPLKKELGLTRIPKLLPVLVTGAREPIALAVVRGLHSALSRLIDGRKKLHARDAAAAILTQGTADDRKVVELIEACSAELIEKGHFDGILLIIDELGKSLEFAALNPEKQDIYFLQTLAESSSRSADAPVYTLGLLHQGFADYAEKLTNTAQLEWAKVAERFSEITFSQPLGQVATLIGSALALNDDGTTLWGWKGKASSDMAEAIDLGMFGPSPGKGHLTQIAPALYPLHATVIPVLSRFFRRFGQNERSLFSFLLSSEPFALQDFAIKDAGPNTVFRLANFYDYAANNFAHRLSGQSFRSHWNHIDARIRSMEGESDEVQNLLKTIGILNVVSSAELYPTEDLLALALGVPSSLSKDLKDLTRRGVIFNRGRAGYSLWPHASVNLEQRFEEASEKVTRASRIATVVRERLDSRPIVARRHYIQTGNLRHFDVRFLTASEFSAEHDLLNPVHPADGVIAVILCESASERKAAMEVAGSFDRELERVVVAVSAPLDVLTGCALELERWEWVERHTPELKDDRFAAEEVSRQIAASRGMLEGKLQELVGFRGETTGRDRPKIAWFHKGEEKKNIGDDQNLQSFLSDLCGDLFPEAPHVRNELVNRHSISSAAAAARQKLFKAMLEDSAKPNLGLPEDKAPPEKSMYLSVLQEGGVHVKKRDQWKLQIPSPDPLNLSPALNAIVTRLDSKGDMRVSVGELYEMLRREYGVRDGLIPILLLIVFIVHETEIAIYEDDVFQPEIEEFLWMRLARRPETFEFQLCRITGIRKAIISQLAAALNSQGSESSELLSIVRPLYQFVGGLPDYARNTDQLSPETIALRKAIESAREPAQLVFHAIPEALKLSKQGKGELDAKKLAARLTQSVTELRRCFPELQNRMSDTIRQAFQFEGSLQDFRETTSGSAETVLVGLGDPDFRAFCLKLLDAETPEAEWLEALGSLLTRCPPSRWKDRDELVFRERIHALAAQFNRVLATCFDRDGSLPDTAVRLAVTPRSGAEKNIVVNLNPQQSKEAADLLTAIRKQLPANSQISLAALSRLIWDILPKAE